MLKPISFFKRAISSFTKDSVSLILMLIPVIIGIIIYSTGFYYLWDFIMGYAKEYLEGFMQTDSFWLKALFWLIRALLTVMCFFIVNWTFVLIVSLIGSPFNDLISERVEKKYLGEPLRGLSESFASMGKKLIFTLVNESKKIFFIGILSLIALVLGYFPMFTPLAFVITFILISIQFVDYTWARHDLAFGSCLKNVTGSLWHYLTAGAMYFFLINIPILNLFVPAIATAHYTLYFVEKSRAS